eukprot:scaffold74715_cov24-Phaeocystis_antarctica.AAC.1
MSRCGGFGVRTTMAVGAVGVAEKAEPLKNLKVMHPSSRVVQRGDSENRQLWRPPRRCAVHLDPPGTADHLGDSFAAETGARWPRVMPATERLP